MTPEFHEQEDALYPAGPGAGVVDVRVSSCQHLSNREGHHGNGMEDLVHFSLFILLLKCQLCK